MRVVFLEDVAGVAQGGDVKEVKNGFARNYLIPKNLAAPATHNVLQRVESLQKKAEVARVEELEDMRALAELVDGFQINVEMRAGSGGRLYGSVTNTMIADELSKLVGHEVDRRAVEIAEPIRQVGIFGANIGLHIEVQAAVKVLVYATGTDPSEVEAMVAGGIEASEDADEAVGDLEIDEAAEPSEPEVSEEPVAEPEAPEVQGDTIEPEAEVTPEEPADGDEEE